MVTMDGTDDDEREALVHSPESDISYESFPRRVTPIRTPSYTASSSFLDALSHVSSETTVTGDSSSPIAPKTKGWLTNLTARARYRLSRQEFSRWCKICAVFQRLRQMSSAPERLFHAMLITLIGLGTALLAYISDMGESHLFDWKFGLCASDWTTTKTLCCSDYSDCPNWRTWSQIARVSEEKFSGFNFAIYLASGVLLALASHVLTRLAPMMRPSWYRCGDGNSLPPDTHPLKRASAAAGSGVSIVKQAVHAGSVTLDGAPTPWMARTVLLKTMGIILSTSSGLSVGKEGPYVHLSAATAYLLSSWPYVRARANMPTRKVLCVGAAAGLAAAFGAPAAGLVFVVEDFGQGLTAQGLLAPLLGGGAVAVVALAALGPYGTGRAVPWEIRYPQRTTTTSCWWAPGDVGLFVIVGVAAGVLGALFIMAVGWWSRHWRRLSLVRRYPALDVALVAIITACSTFWDPDLRCGTAELLSRLAESAGTDGQHHAEARGLSPLVFGLVVRFTLTVITFGLEVPQGIYMPSMAMGAMLGHFIGHAGLAVAGSTSTLLTTHPAISAMAGAGAVMAATTRLQLTIMVLVFETTRSWEYMLPMAVSICISKAVAARLEPRSIYQLVAHLEGQTPLGTLLGSSSFRVKDVWDPRSADGGVSLSLHLGPRFAPEPVYGLRQLLSASTARGVTHVPVLKDGLRFVGCVSVQSIREALEPQADSTRVLLYHLHVLGVLRISVAGAGEAGSNDDDDDQRESMQSDSDALNGSQIDLDLLQSAVFESSSTLSSIHAYLSCSDAEFVCATERSTSWAVITREVLAAWVLDQQ